jgi:hypothetical protein
MGLRLNAKTPVLAIASGVKPGNAGEGSVAGYEFGRGALKDSMIATDARMEASINRNSKIPFINISP